MGIFNIFGFGGKKEVHLSENDREAISFLETLMNRIGGIRNEAEVHKDSPNELSKVVTEFKQTLDASRRELIKRNIRDSQMVYIPEFKFSNSNFHSEFTRLEHSLDELSTKIELIIKQIQDDSKAQYYNNLRQQAANDNILPSSSQKDEQDRKAA